MFFRVTDWVSFVVDFFFFLVKLVQHSILLTVSGLILPLGGSRVGHVQIPHIKVFTQFGYIKFSWWNKRLEIRAHLNPHEQISLSNCGRVRVRVRVRGRTLAYM